MKTLMIAALLALIPAASNAQTTEEWIALGTKVHGGFGAFIPLGIKIGLDALDRMKAKPRDVAIVYLDSPASPCACFADGIAIATMASVGQRSLVIAPEKAPDDALAVAIIRPRKGGAGFKYTIPKSALPRLGAMNQSLDEKGRFDAVMAADDLFRVEPAP